MILFSLILVSVFVYLFFLCTFSFPCTRSSMSMQCMFYWEEGLLFSRRMSLKSEEVTCMFSVFSPHRSSFPWFIPLLRWLRIAMILKIHNWKLIAQRRLDSICSVGEKEEIFPLSMYLRTFPRFPIAASPCPRTLWQKCSGFYPPFVHLTALESRSQPPAQVFPRRKNGKSKKRTPF